MAVIDADDKVVITVLPMDYHENLAWRVSDAAQRAARTLVVGDSTECSRAGGQFKLLAYVRDEDGQVRVARLGKWPSSPYDGSVARLLDDDAFFADLNGRLRGRGVTPEQCEAVYVRIGSGTPTRVAMRIRSST